MRIDTLYACPMELQTLPDIELAKKKILIVDDEWAILELLKFKLARLGYAVITAGTEKEFWKRAFAEKPDLVILDIWLKNKLGTDIYENMLQFGFNPKTPVIFISALIIA